METPCFGHLCVALHHSPDFTLSATAAPTRTTDHRPTQHLIGDAVSLTPRSGTPPGHLLARPRGVESLHRWSHPETCHRDILWTSSKILSSQIPPELSEPPKQLLFSEESCLFLPRDQRPHLRQLPHKVMLLFLKIPPPQPIKRVSTSAVSTSAPQHHVRKQSPCSCRN